MAVDLASSSALVRACVGVSVLRPSSRLTRHVEAGHTSLEEKESGEGERLSARKHPKNAGGDVLRQREDTHTPTHLPTHPHTRTRTCAHENKMRERDTNKTAARKAEEEGTEASGSGGLKRAATEETTPPRSSLPCYARTQGCTEVGMSLIPRPRGAPAGRKKGALR